MKIENKKVKKKPKKILEERKDRKKITKCEKIKLTLMAIFAIIVLVFAILFVENYITRSKGVKLFIKEKNNLATVEEQLKEYENIDYQGHIVVCYETYGKDYMKNVIYSFINYKCISRYETYYFVTRNAARFGFPKIKTDFDIEDYSYVPQKVDNRLNLHYARYELSEEAVDKNFEGLTYEELLEELKAKDEIAKIEIDMYQ